MLYPTELRARYDLGFSHIGGRMPESIFGLGW